MVKRIEGIFDGIGPTLRELRNMFKKKKEGKIICYVLITCQEAKEDGTMQVEMKYEGKRWLAAYLVSNAQEILEQPGDDDDLL